MSIFALLLLILLLFSTANVLAFVIDLVNVISVFDVLEWNSSAMLHWPSEEYPIARIDNNFVMEITMWNLASAKGNSTMLYENGSVIFNARHNDMVLKNPNAWVAGYPEVYYGVKPWNNVSVSGFSKLKLPMLISKLPYIYVKVSMFIHHSKSLPINAAFDLWLTQQPGGPVNRDSIEVMIWLYSNNLLPAGRKTSFILKDGITRSVWEVWIRCREANTWTIVSFRSIRPLINKTIIIELNEFIENALKYAGEYCELNLSDNALYLNDIELGTEFGSPYTIRAVFGWALKELKILVIDS